MLSSHPCCSEGVPLLHFLLDTAAICWYVPFSMPLHADTCQYVLWLLWGAWVSLLSSLKGVGPLIRRLRAQVPQGVGTVALDVPARESLPDDAYITLARIAASFA